MKWFRRSFIYVKRNINKTIHLFLIIFVLGNMMCLVSSLRTSSSYLSSIIKSKIGATLVYKDIRYNSIDNHINNDEDLQNIYRYEQILNQMIHHESVKYGNYSYMMYLDDEWGNLHYGYGLSSYPMVDVLENKLEIVEGREITQEEIEKGEYVVLVSENSLYNGKEIKLHDEIKMNIQNNMLSCNEEFECESNTVIADRYTLKVVGIFKKTDKVFDNLNKEFDNISNRWYIPNKTLIHIFEIQNNLNDKESGNPLKLAIDEPFIRLKNSEDLNLYIKDIQPLLLKEKDEEGNSYDTLYTSDDEFMILSKPIQILSNLGNALLFGSAVVFSIILSILFISIIKDRLYEIAIYLSIGEQKRNIILQIFLELMIISTMSVSFSFATGTLLGKQIIHELISQKTVFEYEMEPIESNQIEYFTIVYGCSCIIILLSLIYPFFVISKQNPKVILLK